jgi:hypothetical protein
MVPHSRVQTTREREATRRRNFGNFVLILVSLKWFIFQCSFWDCVSITRTIIALMMEAANCSETCVYQTTSQKTTIFTFFAVRT